MAAEREKALLEEIENLRTRVRGLEAESQAQQERERTFRQAENRFKALFNNAQVGVFRSKLSDGTLLEINEKLARMLRFSSREEALKTGFITADHYVHPEQRANIVKKAMESGGIVDCAEIELRRIDGTVFTIMWSGTIDREKDLIDGVFIDISERKKMERDLLERERKLSSIFRAVPIGLGIVTERLLVELNDGLCEISGYCRGELLNQVSRILYPTEEDFERAGRDSEAQIQKFGTANLECIWRHKSGREIDVMITLVPLEPGNPRNGLTFSVLDITQRKKAELDRQRLETQLRHAQRIESIGRLAGGVAHDLNNLLSPILGFSDLLLMETEESDPKHFKIREILTAAQRAQDLSRQLLTFSRKQPQELKPVDLRKVVESLRKLLRRTIPENITITANLPPVLSNIRGDMGQLEQMLMNLIVNAQDAMPKGGTLILALEETWIDEGFPNALGFDLRPGKHVLLRVADSGTGMSPNVLSRLFEPFFTTKEVNKGTGLGLSMVYGIVKQHGGSIHVYSEPDRGTTFKIFFPATEEKPGSSSIQDGSAADFPGKGQLILIVEDNESVRKLAEMILSKLGYRVMIAESPELGLEILRKDPDSIDLILTDVIMPGMNGHELFQMARTIRPGIKVVFMSGYDPNLISHHGILEEGVVFLQKPFTSFSLVKKISEGLEKP